MKLKVRRHGLVRRRSPAGFRALVRGIVHDLNNALLPVLGFSDIVLKRPALLTDVAKMRHYMGEINRAAREAVSLVDRLRATYRKA